MSLRPRPNIWLSSCTHTIRFGSCKFISQIGRNLSTDIALDREIEGKGNHQQHCACQSKQRAKDTRPNMPFLSHFVTSSLKPYPQTAAMLTSLPSNFCRKRRTVSSVARVSTAVSNPHTWLSSSSRETATLT